ncbi:cytochrome c biogenesis protein ResB [Rothia nasimurium]|uniref:cytochrome c biogenesis protein ResB n=1 Tax=Rothia nasimurium TaxID=85336 RepID=UPI001F48477C|nr:cytochrome c biogenesis protein ResB [Rothia nasimurium]
MAERHDAPALGAVEMLRWAWTQLTKMNTALFLLLMLAIAAVPGSVFPQRIQDPAKVNDYIEAHPTWGPIADKLQLFDVFSSAWFAAIYLLLFISLIGCVIPRAIKHYKAMRSAPARTPKNLSRLPQHRVLTIPLDATTADLTAQQAIKDAAEVLKKRRYRVEVREEEDGAVNVAAERGYLRELGNILFHLAMIGVLIAVAVGSLFGYSGQRVLTEDETFVNSLAAYDSFSPGTNYNPNWLAPYSATLDTMTVEYDRQKGSPTYGNDINYEAQLTLTTANGDTRQETLKVNEPVYVEGTSIYLLGNGYAPIIRVTNTDGTIAHEGPVVGLPSGMSYLSSVVLKVPDATPSQLGFVGMFLPTGEKRIGAAPTSIDSDLLNPMVVFQSYTGDLGLDDGTPQNVYVLDIDSLDPLNTMAMGNGIILDSANPTATLPNGHGTIELLGVKRYAGLEIRSDPGRPIALASALLLFAGLLTSVFVARRRVWVRATETGTGSDRTLTIEYGLLARGEDPRLATEADRLTDLFAERWGLEFDEA